MNEGNPALVRVDNVNAALYHGIQTLKAGGKVAVRRGMKVLEYPRPFMTVYDRPRECVLFSSFRDCNPFFHYFEALWMLAGRNDAAFLKQFTKQIWSYAEDDGTLHGAYGHRLTQPINQFEYAARQFREDLMTRRVVLQMWDSRRDLNVSRKDVPCNTQIYFSVESVQGLASTYRLNMTVCNRSNDLIWGAYGANAVHFAFIQEFMRAMVAMVHPDKKILSGVYCQMSNNAHVYVENAQSPTQADLTNRILCATDARLIDNRYRRNSLLDGHAETTLRIGNPNEFVEILNLMLGCFDVENDPLSILGMYVIMHEIRDLDNKQFFATMCEMAALWHTYRCSVSTNQVALAEVVFYNGHADWVIAGREWIQRRIDNAKKKTAHE